LFILSGIAYLLFFSWIFQIRDVMITGGNEFSEEDIKSFFLSKNVFLMDEAKIKKRILNDFPRIARVEIQRRFPTAFLAVLQVEIVKKEAAAVWCDQEQTCFLIDETGMMFEKVLTETALVRIFGEKDLLEEKMVKQILEISSKLKKDLDIETERAKLVSWKRLDVKTAEGWEIYFNLEENLNWQLTRLHLLLERKISLEERRTLQYIDLRFSRIYYK